MVQNEQDNVVSTTESEAPAVPETNVSEEQVVETTSNVNTTETENASAQQDSDGSIAMEDISKLSSFIHSQGIKDALNEQMESVRGSRSKLLETVDGLEASKDFISEKLTKFESEAELKKYLENPKHVEELLTDAAGNTLDLAVTIEDPKRALEFKREFLVYLKVTDDAYRKIDEEYEKMERETSEIEIEIGEACKQLSDSVLTYISYLSDKALECQDEIKKAKILETVKYIRSGYDFSIYNDILDEHPNVANNIVKELTKDQFRVTEIGGRYTSKLARNDVKVSLIPLVSKDEKRSIEEMVLVKDDEYTHPDLFIYSIIRYFSMANWDDDNVRKAHASIALVMKKLMNNEFENDIRQDILRDMVKYIARFPK